MQVLARVKTRQMSGTQAVMASLIGAAFTAICAQITFNLPGNPVPVTMQVFAVICCGLVLGSRYGALAQIEYLTAGLLGAPVFAGFRGGPASIALPTWGYIVGFIAAAYIVGRIIELFENPSMRSACIAGIAGVGIIHSFGAAWLSIWLQVFSGHFAGWGAWVLGSAPFIGVDTLKVFLAAWFCVGPRR